jgi:hypothetical protein
MSELEASDVDTPAAAQTEVVPARSGWWPWTVVAAAVVVAVASTAFFWLNRPQWGYCIDGTDFGYCADGVFSSNAIVASIILGVAVLGLVAAVLLARGMWRGRIILIVVGVFVAVLIVAWLLQLVTLEDVPIPSDPENGPLDGR